MNTKYIERVTRITVLPQNEPLFSTQATHISIEDEAAGECEFLEISQVSASSTPKPETIRIEPQEWPDLKSAIEKMIGNLNNNHEN